MVRAAFSLGSLSAVALLSWLASAAAHGGWVRGGPVGEHSAKAARHHTLLASASGLVAELPSLAKGEGQGEDSWGRLTLHEIFGGVVFLAFGAFIFCSIPVVHAEWRFYTKHLQEAEDNFVDYLGYRFTHWFTTSRLAPSLVLLLLTMGLIVLGAIMYALLVGGSPFHALWRIFVWSTGSPADGEVTPGGRFLGIMVTVCGLIILSLLLGIVSEVFASKMEDIKLGLSKVVEGGHVVILGYTECTHCLLEELANARESEGGGCFVILSPLKKEDVDQSLHAAEINLRNSRLLVRSGNACTMRDLYKVAAGAASQVVILADTSISQEESDAKSVRTLLALKTKGWPHHGHITLQCCCEANRELFKNLYGDKVEVVVVGDIVAKLMAQSSLQHGLAVVFGMMLGFEGDEFYFQEWPELVGLTFKEAVFRFPDAVALGVFDVEGMCRLNPGWDYRVRPGDKIIVLAQDNDTYKPADKPYFAYDSVMLETLGRSRRDAFVGRGQRATTPSKILIIGWNPKIGPLLSSLDEMVAMGSLVDIYSPRSEEQRKQDISKLEQQHGRRFEALSIKHVTVEDAKMTSRLELERLRHQQHDSIFVLADVALAGRAGADERTMAALAQLQHLNVTMPMEESKMFDPVVEMCEDATEEHLKICGFTNFVHSNSLVSQALAAVAEEPAVNAIYSELMSTASNQFEFRGYQEFLPAGAPLPLELSFGEAAHRISLAGEISLVAWSTTSGPTRSWIMNPKDKVTPRPWTPQDLLVVIRRFH